jgi:hypothetical protein
MSRVIGTIANGAGGNPPCSVWRVGRLGGGTPFALPRSVFLGYPTVFRCRDDTVLKIILTQKFSCPLLSICNSCDRNLVVICVLVIQTFWGAKK